MAGESPDGYFPSDDDFGDLEGTGRNASGGNGNVLLGAVWSLALDQSGDVLYFSVRNEKKECASSAAM